MPELKNFPLPDVGEGLTEAEILGWRVQPGDTVRLNEVFVEIETAKAAVELPCAYEGRVVELLVEPGQTVEVGTPIISIDVDPEGAAPGSDSQPGEAGTGSSGIGRTGERESAPAAPSAAASSSTASPSAEGESGEVANLVGYGPRASSAKRRPRKQQAATGGTGPASTGPASTGPAGTGPAGQAASGTTALATPPAPERSNGTAPTGQVPLAKPPVRKLAKDLGVDLRSLAGSGSGGVITRQDVEAATAGAPEPGSATDVAGREHRVPVKGVRKATAQAMVESAFTAPHVTEFLTVDVTPMMELRERLKSHPQYRDVKVTPLAFAAKALCLAARRTPDVNAAWDEQTGEIVYKDYIHLGIAAATPRGLVVPKVRDADGMSLRELAVALDSLTSTARDGKTPPGDMTNGTITITNVGVFGVDTGTPILNPGESAILAFGAIRDMPWVVDGQVVPRKVCQLALSFDHRVVDGQQGSQFLADVGELLSDPGMAITF
ncbi:dihydrolipoamide acetyltransferase family protein [Parasphingorhabdus pacifica]